MRSTSTLLLLLLPLLVLLTSGAWAQSSDDSPIGPLTTNNAQSACVEYGDCTSLPAGATDTTATQLGGVTSPASSENVAGPTNSAETLASLSELAAQGGSAAFASTATGAAATGTSADTSVALTASAQVADSTITTGLSGLSSNAAYVLGGSVGNAPWSLIVASSLMAMTFGAGAVLL